MSLQLWLSFVAVAAFLVMSPGPNGVLVLKTLGAHGYSASLMNILGLFCATFCHGALVLLGLSALLLHLPGAFLALKILGALYLFYLGVKLLKKYFRPAQAAPPRKRFSGGFQAGFGAFWLEGFLTQILNPNVSAFYLAVFPSFIPFGSPDAVVQTLLLNATHAVIIALWFILLAGFSAKLAPKIRGRQLGRTLNGLAGLGMIYFAMMVLWIEPPHIPAV